MTKIQSESRIEDTTDDQATDMLAPQFPETPDWVPPVQVSGSARKALAAKFRKWSGWGDAQLILANPRDHVKNALSEIGMVDSEQHIMYLNVDKLSLNPNRVLLTVNPFRLRQEAVMTGIMLHEAGHARHSHWRAGETAETPAIHGDGGIVSEPTMRLACLMEEPRVEGLMARDAADLGAARLGWTMRASAAHLLPITRLSKEPGQQIMDLVSAWTLRAGRCVSYGHHTGQTMPDWVSKFGTFLCDEIEGWLESQDDDRADIHSVEILNLLTDMSTSTDDTSTYMVDTAREVLRLLYPKGDPNGQGAPMPGAGCVSEGAADDAQDGDQSEDSDQPSETAVKLKQIEQQADSQTEAEAKNDGEGAEGKGEKPTENDKNGGTAGGRGGGNWTKVEARNPTKDERQLQRDAERFLRSIIAPTERTITSLSDSPSATVDAVALAMWKAGGQVGPPRFFKRTKREILPAPPVDVAILGDISSSMEELQRPQAVLAWALSAAMTDLSNFAGRGQQIRSCMIHWGDKAEVVQHVGDRLTGIREVPCPDGTYALGPAMRLIEDEMPGFLDPPADGKPTNRLIVMFSDWEHSSMGRDDAHAQVTRALQAGVNIVTVAPQSYRSYSSMLPAVEQANADAPGMTTFTRYDSNNPAGVWDEAAAALAEARR